MTFVDLQVTVSKGQASMYWPRIHQQFFRRFLVLSLKIQYLITHNS